VELTSSALNEPSHDHRELLEQSKATNDR